MPKFIIIAASALSFATIGTAALADDSGRGHRDIATPLYFTYSGQLVTYTVPKTGTYRIVAYGAQGGSGQGEPPQFCFPPGPIPVGPGGKGAEIGGDFLLTAGEVLQIAVGGVGEGGAAGGGGGGTFVVGPDNAPLVIAGGGGGGGNTCSVGLPGGGGLTGQDGGKGFAPGGTGGNGGAGANTISAPDTGGGGGGGFLSAGGNAFIGPVEVSSTGGGGFPNGAGGNGDGGGAGGFGGGGGGGAGSGGGGGGGGYSGGGAGGGGGGENHFEIVPGGGGGSFNAGTGQILVADFQAGSGLVVITKAFPAFAGSPGKSDCHGTSIAALGKQYGGLNGAAAALGFDGVNALQGAIEEFCEA